jgi:myosin-5
MLVPSTEWSTKLQDMKLKDLCNIILSKSITDPDKYQSGLTKIFFRAGMLAALESMRSARLNALVTLVQKNVRRQLAVKKYQTMRRSAIKIQTWWRGITARRFVERVRREAAVLRLQTGLRAFVQRKRFNATRRSVILIQSRLYIHSCRDHHTHRRSGIRGARARANFREQRTVGAATLLQSLFRGVYVCSPSYRTHTHYLVVWRSAREEATCATWSGCSLVSVAASHASSCKH